MKYNVEIRTIATKHTFYNVIRVEIANKVLHVVWPDGKADAVELIGSEKISIEIA